MEHQRLTRCVLYQEYFDLLGNAKDSMVLGQMVYWQSKVGDFDLYQKEINEKNIAHGLEEVELQNGWIYKSNVELAEEVKIAKEDAIGKSLNRLVELGFLTKRRNPQYKRDKTNQYRVDVSYLKSELEKLNYSIPNYEFTIPIKSVSSPTISVLKPTGSVAIPETTTKTTTKTTTYIEQKRFSKPTVDDVRTYCIERKNNIKPETFISYYESIGRYIGKNPMKDWKACIRTRETKDRGGQQKERRLPNINDIDVF